jgi:hypothetical protein
MSGCRRTAAILDAWFDTGQLSDRDWRHLAGCDPCTAAFARRDVFDADLRAAVRSLVLEPEAVGTRIAAPVWHPPELRFRAGLASLATVVVLAVVVGIRVSSSTPAAPAEPLLPVPVEPAEQALHQSGLRCEEAGAGLECVRRLSDGWRQVARLDVSGGAVQHLELRLDPGTAAYPLADVSAALAEPAADVLGVDLSEAIDQAVDAAGVACGCTRQIEGGSIHIEGDPVAGYVLDIEAAGTQP